MLRKGSSQRVGAQATGQSTVIPAPTGGMDDRIGVGADNPDVCLWAINIMPAEFGMRVRNGYRAIETGLPSEVRTIIPYEGLVETNLDDKIFAVCAQGIYDCTGAGTPVQKLPFADTGENAGWGTYIHYIDASGDDIVYYADGANGLFIYTPETDVWAQASGIVPDITPGSASSQRFAVILTFDDERIDANTLPGGAVGQAAIYTDSVKATHVIRRVMLRMQSWMNYLLP